MNWWSAFTIGFLTGGIIALLGARLFQEEVEEGAGESQDKKNGSVMTKAFLHKVSQGPEIVAIGGGTGLSTLLSGLKYYTRNITAIVTVTDEGGSSGRLRGEWGVLPPGDIRNCMLALAEDDSSLNRLLNYRFDRGELKGHSMGNLILLAATEMTGDFSLLVPAMGAVSVAVLLIGDSTIFREQVQNRSRSPAHRDEYMVEILEDIHVDDVMVPRDRIVAVSPDDSIGSVLRLIDRTLHTGFPVLDREENLVGIVALDDIRDNRTNDDLPVKNVMSSRVFTVHHACTLRDALNLMVEHDIHHLPVVPVDDPGLLSGLITRTDIMKAYVRRASQSTGRGHHTGFVTLIEPGTTAGKKPDSKGMTEN